jgi:glycerol kinase
MLEIDPTSRPVSVAGSAIKWLRDSMKIISSAAEVNDLAVKEPTSGGLYFVTAFSGLLAPYWDPGAAGLLIGELLAKCLDFSSQICPA